MVSEVREQVYSPGDIEGTVTPPSPGAKSQKRPRNGFLVTPSIHKV